MEELPFYIKFILVMISVILADIAWAYYFIKIEERKSIYSGLWASVVILFSGMTTMGYMHDKRLFIAALIGSFIGTAGAVEYKKRKEDKSKNP